MPDLPSNPLLPQHPFGGDPTTKTWAAALLRTLTRLWSDIISVVNALSDVDTLANRRSTPDINEIFFTATDTDQLFIGVSGAWRHTNRVGGTSFGAIEFTEISDAAAPSANGARLYARDNGAGKTQLVVRFNTGAIQVIATEP